MQGVPSLSHTAMQALTSPWLHAMRIQARAATRCRRQVEGGVAALKAIVQVQKKGQPVQQQVAKHAPLGDDKTQQKRRGAGDNTSLLSSFRHGLLQPASSLTAFCITSASKQYPQFNQGSSYAGTTQPAVLPVHIWALTFGVSQVRGQPVYPP